MTVALIAASFALSGRAASAAAPAQACVPTVTVVHGPANLRSGPGTNFGAIGGIPESVSVAATGRNANSTWYQVRYGNAVGWVSGTLLAPSCVQNLPVVNTRPPNPANPAGPAPVKPAPQPQPAANPQNPANFSANPTSINIPGCTTLSWSISQNLVYGVYLGENGNYRGVPGNGSAKECPTTPSTYTLRINYKNGQKVETPLNIAINNTAPVQVQFSATNNNIQRGGCTNLQWTIADFQNAYLVDPGSGSATQVGPTGNIKVCPQRSVTYFLRITGLGGGLVQPQVNINVY